MGSAIKTPVQQQRSRVSDRIYRNRKKWVLLRYNGERAKIAQSVISSYPDLTISELDVNWRFGHKVIEEPNADHDVIFRPFSGERAEVKCDDGETRTVDIWDNFQI